MRKNEEMNPLVSDLLAHIATGSSDLNESVLESETVWTGRFLKVQRDRVRLPDGKEASREFVRHPGAVVIVPLLEDGRYLVERQYRHAVDRVMIEFPAGKLDPGEDGLACARRELIEETGFDAREWAYAGVMHNCIGYSDEHIDIWFARRLCFKGQHLEEGELLHVHGATLEDLLECVRQGELTDAKTLSCLLWMQNLDGRGWTLPWKQVTVT